MHQSIAQEPGGWKQTALPLNISFLSPPKHEHQNFKSLRRCSVLVILTLAKCRGNMLLLSLGCFSTKPTEEVTLQYNWEKISARFARPTCRLASKEINPWILTSQHKVLQWIVRPCSAVLFQLGTLTWCAASAALIMSAAGFGGNGVPSFWAHQGKPETPSEICFSARKYEHSKIRFHPPGPMSHSQKNVKTNQ